MGYNLFIDDERDPVPGIDTVIVRSFEEAVEVMCDMGCPDFISFDHDLGEGKNGYDIAKWMIETDLDEEGNFIPYKFKFYVHSQNIIGKENIEKSIGKYVELKNIDKAFWDRFKR